MDPSAHGAFSDTTQDSSSVVNLFEYPAIGDIDRDGRLDLSKVGMTLNGLVNLVLVGQNEPFHHVLQAWTGATGSPAPGLPQGDRRLRAHHRSATRECRRDQRRGRHPQHAGAGLRQRALPGARLRRERARAVRLAEADRRWHVGQPAAGDLDDDGLVEVAWGTREGNFFVWDTPAPISNTATTANLDGRDGTYNPQVNLWNNSRYGQDTVPPARFRASSRPAARTGAPTRSPSTSHAFRATTCTAARPHASTSASRLRIRSRPS